MSKDNNILTPLAKGRVLGSALSDILKTRDTNSPLENIDKFFETFRVLTEFIELNDIIDTSLFCAFIRNSNFDQICEVKEKALREMDTLIFAPNNNAQNFISTTKKKCESIEGKFTEIETLNKLPSDFYRDRERFLNEYWNKLSGEEQLVLKTYSDIRLQFSDFYSKFIEKAGLNEIESDFIRVDLAERLLTIRLLQNEKLFPIVAREKGETNTKFDSFLGVLLSENPNTIKKALLRVDKILSNKELTKGNKSDRLRQLNNVLKYFTDLNQSSIQKKIETLITSIDNSKK